MMQLSTLLVTLLHQRDICEPDAIDAFLDPKLTGLHHPEDIPNCTKAADRLAKAVEAKEPIVIYGDYDADGMTATAILYSAIKLAGGVCSYYVPHRIDEGYGLNTQALNTLIDQGATLVVTVDCGITSPDCVLEAKKRNCDIIITDHHAPQPNMPLPEAVAIVHPFACGETPNPHLCGAGVALKLAWHMLQRVCGTDRVSDPMRDFLMDALCLVAIGTIADVVPLVGENRILATFGLRQLTHTKHVGLKALMESTSLTGKSLSAKDVSFGMAPRLNAAGRMGHATEAIDLLTTDDPARAAEVATWLYEQNTLRQTVEREVTEKAIEMVEAMDQADGDPHRVVIVSGKGWHGGVIGIVASRLVERFHRPAIVIGIDENGKGQGSGRSIEGFHLAHALDECKEHLLSCGGHAMAAGLRVQADQVDAFTDAMRTLGAKAIPVENISPVLNIDATCTLGELNYPIVQRIEKMAPFGAGNREPVVLIRDVELVGLPKRMGRSGSSVSMVLRQDGVRMRTVGFGLGELADLLIGIHRVDIAATPVLNTFRNQTTVELHVRDVHWSTGR